ncbi:OmpA family protein [Aestuariibius insulae]|uniref:OmpA family protein n=1 Tax=Aestuariibius insulae TaxID=2058287 RepID=UPI00345E9330
MRLSSVFVVLLAFLLAAGGSILAARVAVDRVETMSVEAVSATLAEEGYDWVSAQGDGLQVILEGTAPSEAMRFRAISTAGSIVDASRIFSTINVDEPRVLAPPRFSVEILRNASGVSLIGLIPASDDREGIVAQVRDSVNGIPVTDLLETASHTARDGWTESLDYGLRALAMLPRSKISVEAGQVSVTAISDNEEQKFRFENQLRRRIPGTVDVTLDISAPRPVITPFTLRFVIDENGARFDACSVDAVATQRQIESAARQSGWSGTNACTEGLGMPSRTWGAAVSMAIKSLASIGRGSVTFSDTDVTLVAAEGTPQDLFDREIGELENALPELYQLFPVLPVAPSDDTVEIPEFTAIRSPEGLVQLRGRVSDELMNQATETYALARLGTDEITMGTRISEDVPPGWSVRVLAGIEALAELSNGSVIVQPDIVTVRGNTGNTQANAEIAGLLTDKLGDGEEFEIDVTYVEQLNPIAGLPTPEECIEQIESVVATAKISFEPGSATIDATGLPVMDNLATIFQRCSDNRIEIAGYTDSQGREVMNQQLSQERAQAVLNALRARRVPTGRFTAIGYGEADPIADNGTEEGREANRRIEFRLIRPEPIDETTALEELEPPLESVQEEAPSETPEAAQTDEPEDEAPDEQN